MAGPGHSAQAKVLALPHGAAAAVGVADSAQVHTRTSHCVRWWEELRREVEQGRAWEGWFSFIHSAGTTEHLLDTEQPADSRQPRLLS